MQDSAKYLIHGNITADGVVERSDVVGAVFGQTEGLLGDELDLRDLQSASKVGRIDVDIDSEHGQSVGNVTIASNLDRVETAILAAALETIERIGPCRATVEVQRIEDSRAAKRREVVERAKSLLWEAFDDSIMSSHELIEEVRAAIRIEDISSYNDLPAGPNVEDSDAIIIVEGRADVLTLLQYGIKNAVAVEGTNVPDAIAALTSDRTVTAFLDGDRGGELILKELAQVANIDFVTFAPEGDSVEELSRQAVVSALRAKLPYERIKGVPDPLRVVTTSIETGAGNHFAQPDDVGDVSSGPSPAEDQSLLDPSVETPDTTESPPTKPRPAIRPIDQDNIFPPEEKSDLTPDHVDTQLSTLTGNVEEIIESNSESVRLLTEDLEIITQGAAESAFDLIKESDPSPSVVIIDDRVGQRIIDVAAQRGVDHIIAADTGEFVKRPTSVRLQTGNQVISSPSY